MAITITDFCEEVNNYFDQVRIFGTFEIKNGSLDLSDPDVKDGQYIRIVGSTFNDGVHSYPVHDLEDEKFHGAVWAMAVPSSVIAQITEINQWETDNLPILNSPYQSESFGGYSYTKMSGEAGSSTSWQSHFKRKLDRWRKV
jgi:hypothetical protein